MNTILKVLFTDTQIDTRFPQIFIFGSVMVLISFLTVYVMYTEIWKTDWEYNWNLLLNDYLIPKNDLVDKYIYQDAIDEELDLKMLSTQFINDLLSGRTRGTIKIENNKTNTKITVSDIFDRLNVPRS